MEADKIPEEFRYQTFQPTGGVWSIHDDHIVELVLGPKVEEHKHVVAEAHWIEDLYTRLKALDRMQQWNAIVSLHKQPARPNPPLEMRIVFANILKDPQTRRAGMVNFSIWQQRIIKLYIVTSASRHKLKFFDSADEARKWILG